MTDTVKNLTVKTHRITFQPNGVTIRCRSDQTIAEAALEQRVGAVPSGNWTMSIELWEYNPLNNTWTNKAPS